MSFPVKWLHSNMQGAPQITTANGDLTSMLDAVLVNGFNVRAIASLTRAGTTATVTIAAGHLYEQGQIVKIAGCDQAAYNGDQRVLTRTGTTFTFEVAGAPATPATGAAKEVRSAPLGFEIAYSGANKRAYRSQNALSNKPILRVDDSLDPAYNAAYAKKGKVTLCQGMSDIDTFVGKQAPFDSDAPTKNHVASGSGASVVDGWFKWYYAKSTAAGTPLDSDAPAPGARSWLIVGDDRGFYLFCEWGPQRGRTMYAFTDFSSYRTGDAFNSILVATETYSAANVGWLGAISGYSADGATNSTRTGDAMGKRALASHLQTGAPVPLMFTSLGTRPGANTASGYQTGCPWPNGPDYGLLMHPVYLQEAAGGHLRGKMPGLLWIHNDTPAVSHLDVVDGVAGYGGKQFLIASAQMFEGQYTNVLNQCRLAFDITGPWW